ncbi:MAG: flavin reductase family protein [Verrucomicrobiales bacterium]|jgi:flavin reductase (DIM6/NTAB) family NADH-FMN oxidoreductase RutF
MEFDFEGKDLPQAYKLLAGLVTPRPIAWVTTIDEEGRVNAAPFSFFNVFGADPPIVAFAPGNRAPGIPKDTARNLRRNGQFVVNLANETLADAMVACAASRPHGENELDHVNLTTAPSTSINTPRIAEAPVSLECTEWSTLEIGRNRLVIGVVKRVHVQEGILDPQTLHVNLEAYRPIGRMHGPDGYTRTRDVFTIERPD